MTESTHYTYLSSAFFFLHIINAYEDNNHIVIDVSCYDNADMLKCMTIEALEVCSDDYVSDKGDSDICFRTPKGIRII
jgi:hypothetical protein